MRDIVDIFRQYVEIDTQSRESAETIPSTPGQWDLAHLLEKELRTIGISDIMLDKHCYLYAKIPANTTKEYYNIGLIAHLDTSPDEKGSNVKLNITDTTENELVITSDGTTLLGADDKAGIAEIMSALEFFMSNPTVEHGDIYVAFTPDEEIGRGTDFFDLSYFTPDFAYTVDGGEEGELEIENFNAARFTITINGKNHHPGYAKGKMINAVLVASKIIEVLSSDQIPENTEGHVGFFHVTSVSGDVSHATVNCLIRDFDEREFKSKKQFAEYVVDSVNKQFGEGTVQIDIEDQYKNMFEVICKYPHIVELAKKAMKAAGVQPKLTPIRGGTDGVKLSFMGMPCPNLFTGGKNFHSKEECIPLRSMYAARDTLVHLIKSAEK